MLPFGSSGTIYDAPPSFPARFNVGDPDLEEQMGSGMQAAHVWVSNPTNQYIYLPDADDLMPPGITGRVFALKRTDVARASWTIPPEFGIVQPAPIAGAARFIFLNVGVDIQPQAGTATPSQAPVGSVVTTRTQLATATQLGGPGQFLNADVAPAPGSSLEVIIAVPFGNQFTSVKVTGDQSAYIYLNASYTGSPFARTFKVPLAIQAADTSLTVTASGPGFATVTVNALLNAIAVATDRPIWRTPTRIVTGQQVGIGSTVLLAAVAGQSVYLWGFGMRGTVAAAASSAGLQDSSGPNIAELQTISIDKTEGERDGAALTLGAGLNLRVAGGAASVNGWASVSQG